MAESVQQSHQKSAIAALLHEPLLHFLLLAALFIGARHWYQEQQKPEIVVTTQQLEELCKTLEMNRGRTLTPEERTRVAREYVEDELLYREGVKQGLVSDNRVRNLIVQMMRTSLKPVLRDASQAELEALRETLPLEVTQFPAQVSYEQVVFAEQSQVPPGLMEKLKANDVTVGGQRQPMTYRPQLERLLGQEFSKALFEAPLNEWRGPMPSPRGIHFFRVLERREEREIPFSELRFTLMAKWASQKENEAVTTEAARLAEGYRLTLPDQVEPPRNPQK
jgi:hypothetical protein